MNSKRLGNMPGWLRRRPAAKYRDRPLGAAAQRVLQVPGVAAVGEDDPPDADRLDDRELQLDVVEGLEVAADRAAIRAGGAHVGLELEVTVDPSAVDAGGTAVLDLDAADNAGSIHPDGTGALRLDVALHIHTMGVQ